jgi:hypothetical protein
VISFRFEPSEFFDSLSLSDSLLALLDDELDDEELEDEELSSDDDEEDAASSFAPFWSTRTSEALVAI